jgi:hypothetical protein
MTIPVVPNLAGYTTLPHPAIASPGQINNQWAPTLSSGTDYILNLATAKPIGGQIIITGGRNIYIGPGFHTTRADVNGGPNFMIEGGHQARTIFFHGGIMDCSGGFESDGIRTRVGSNGRPPGKGETGATNISMLDCRIVALRGQTLGPNSTPPTPNDDFGNPTSGTHADCIQLAGGLNNLNLGYCTLSSKYANLQLQQELTEVGGTPGRIASSSRVGSTLTVVTTANHNLNPGDWFQLGKCIDDNAGGSGQAASPNGWNGTRKVVTTPTATTVTLDATSEVGVTSLGNITNTGASGATWKKANSPYACGDFDLDHVNVICQLNMQQYISGNPGETINAWRFGGRPDQKDREDQTTCTRDIWTGAATLNEFWIQPRSGGASIGSLINPGSAGSTLGDTRATIDTGVSPNQVRYDSWAVVTGFAKVGTPPGGDYCPAWRPGLRYPSIPLRGRMR